MKRISTYIILLTALLAMITVAGCSKTARRSVPSAPAAVVRLDSAALAGDSAAFLAAGDAARLWMQIVAVDSAHLSEYFSSLQGKPYNRLVETQFSSSDSLAQVAGQIFANIESLGDTVAPSTLATVVAPYNQSIVTADSIVFLVLNHYLGADHAFYAYFPNYQRRLKNPSRIGVDIAEAVIAERFPYTPASKYPTALSRMAAEGALVEAVMQVTGATEQDVLGYTPEEYSWMTENELPAWVSLMDRGMLFATDPSVVENLIRPNSVTTALHPEAPGRAGRFIGHRIVRSYLKSHPSATLNFILSPGFYNDPKLLEKAEYVGK